MTCFDELACRAVECREWRWLPGMLTDHGRICGAGYLVYDDVDDLGAPYVDCADTIDDWPSLLPDFTDPGTLGALLSLVRHAWGDSGAFCECSQILGKPFWSVYLSSVKYRKQRKWEGTGVGDGDTEAEALIAALEAAP